MQDDIRIQALGANDMAVLENTRQGTFDNPVIPAQARAFLQSELHHIVVATNAGQVIGMATAVTMLHPDKEPVVFINEVGVHDDFQRRGIARRLIRALFDLVRANGNPDIWLATEADNLAARALYRGPDARETGDIVVFDWGHAMDDT